MNDKKIVYVNSQNMSYGVNEDFFIDKSFNEFNIIPTSVKLLSASIPYTWDNLVAGIEMIFDDVVSSFNIVLPAGFYDGNTLAASLETFIDINSPQDYTVEFLPITNKLHIYTTGINQFTLTINNTQSSDFFGFPLGTTTPTLDIESTNPTKILSNYEIFICSDLIQGSDNGLVVWNDTVPTYNINNHQILARVPINTCFNKIINYSALPEHPFFTISQSNYSMNPNRLIRFFLKFPNGQNVNLNGYTWGMELLLNFN